jgi:hypothetical protein
MLPVTDCLATVHDSSVRTAKKRPYQAAVKLATGKECRRWRKSGKLPREKTTGPSGNPMVVR